MRENDFPRSVRSGTENPAEILPHQLGIEKNRDRKAWIVRKIVFSENSEENELFLPEEIARNAARQIGFRVAFPKILLETTQSFRMQARERWWSSGERASQAQI